MAKFSFDSEDLIVDWISFNLEGLLDTEMLAYHLSKHYSVSKKDLRLKVRFMKSLAVNERKKKLDLGEFSNPINLSNNQLI